MFIIITNDKYDFIKKKTKHVPPHVTIIFHYQKTEKEKWFGFADIANVILSHPFLLSISTLCELYRLLLLAGQGLPFSMSSLYCTVTTYSLSLSLSLSFRCLLTYIMQGSLHRMRVSICTLGGLFNYCRTLNTCVCDRERERERERERGITFFESAFSRILYSYLEIDEKAFVC